MKIGREESTDLPKLSSIERSIRSLDGVLSGRKIRETARGETKAFFEGLVHSLEDICNTTIANSEKKSTESLKNIYTSIDRIYKVAQKVGDDLSVDTHPISAQLDALFFAVSHREGASS